MQANGNAYTTKLNLARLTLCSGLYSIIDFVYHAVMSYTKG